MITLTRILLVLAAGAGVAGATWAKEDPAAKLAKITEGRVAGPPQQCISLAQIYDVQVIDKTTVVYRMGNTYYVNKLKSGASALDSDDIVVTRTYGSQLCAMDSIHMVDRYGAGAPGFAILGPFIPYTKPKTGGQ